MRLTRGWTQRRIPERPTLQVAIIGGLAATSLMTPVAYVSALQPLDFAAMLGSLVTGETTVSVSGAWLAGMLLHFVNGSLVFPAVYAFVLYPVLPGRPWLKGATYGVALWALAQALVMPLAGMGFFSQGAPRPMAALAWSLGSHLLYGLVLGALVAPWLVRFIEEEEREVQRRAA
ncbi:MAG: hypothetical protein HYU41_07840 [Candidatus Rokubacteria bacterium]|nr:hypothetical protein [Candidatus Rokubacteria bacterium]